MEFRTKIKPERHPGFITYDSPVMMLGSCFSDNIGKRLDDDLFDVIINPTGTLYNPASIRQAVERIVGGEPYGEDDLFEHLGLWHSPHHHSDFSRQSVAEALAIMNGSLIEAHRCIGSISTMIITLGTTRVFRDVESGMIVANCHKLPATRFDEQWLGVSVVVAELEGCIESLRRANPDMKIVFTVSPVRHLASGLEGNSLSKATLRVAVADVCSRYPATVYFPAYEIMMDDLRDYRFYASDMKHPSEVAVDYIYGLFSDAVMEPEVRDRAEECRRLTRRLAHRMSGATPQQKAFAEQTRELALHLCERYPSLKKTISKKL